MGELTPEMKGQKVWLRVRLQNSRKQSAKLGFLVFRQRLSTVQTVVQGKDITAFVRAARIPSPRLSRSGLSLAPDAHRRTHPAGSIPCLHHTTANWCSLPSVPPSLFPIFPPSHPTLPSY